MSNKKVTYSFRPISIPNIIFSLPTAMIGYQIHSSGFWAFMDFIFWPLAWIKWVIFQEVNLTIIKSAFDWFLK
jgi:hypothetical protein